MYRRLLQSPNLVRATHPTAISRHNPENWGKSVQLIDYAYPFSRKRELEIRIFYDFQAPGRSMWKKPCREKRNWLAAAFSTLSTEIHSFCFIYGH